MRQVRVVPYNPQWLTDFARAAREVNEALGDHLRVIHHIGSTSIPGICAKPVIDMLAVATDLSRIDAHTGRMRQIGFEAMGEFGIHGRRYFRRESADGIRTEQVHVFATGSSHVPRHLAFRDYLRTHAEVAREYSELKQRLAAAHPFDIEAYMDGKDAFIYETEIKALSWIAISESV